MTTKALFVKLEAKVGKKKKSPNSCATAQQPPGSAFDLAQRASWSVLLS